MLRPGDWFLLGADLVKSKRRLDAAYNDAAGVTVMFNKNVLRVLNRDLRASFDEEMFDHVAGYDPERELVDIRLRARAAHEVKVRGARADRPLRRGRGDAHRDQREVHPRLGWTKSLAAAGFGKARFWTDRAKDFSLSLWQAR